MKILNVCSHDWANYSYDNMMALRSAGAECDSLKIHPHGFNYPIESKLAKRDQIAAAIYDYDVVQIMHSDASMIPLCLKAEIDNIIVYHTGTGYRQQSETYNGAFNQYVKKCVIALGEFSGLGAKGEYYCSVSVDTDTLQPTGKAIKKPYTIAHYPSSATVKGSSVIVDMAKKIHEERKDFSFLMNTKFVPRKEYMERLSLCDIYIELFALEQNEKKYGSWGTTAVEAAALGKIVITCHTTEQVYEKYYGTKTPFFIANTEAQLEAQINKLLDMDEEQIKSLQDLSRKWAVKYHSYQAVGKYLLKNVLNGL